MDEKLKELLQSYVATANNPEYKSDWKVINSKFPELKDYDPAVLEAYVATANNEEYNSDWDLINSKFPEFSPKKQDEVSTKGSKNTSQTLVEPSLPSQNEVNYLNSPDKPFGGFIENVEADSSIPTKIDNSAVVQQLIRDNLVDFSKPLGNIKTPVETIKQNASTKFKQFEDKATELLQAKYPNRKVEVRFQKDNNLYNKEGGRSIKSQATIKAKGNSQAPVSLHNFNSARDYELVVDGKVISGDKNKQLYKDVLWDASGETGLYHLEDWDVAHISLVEEGKGTAFKNIKEKYSELLDSDEAKASIAYMKANIDQDPNYREILNVLEGIDEKKVNSVKPEDVNRFTGVQKGILNQETTFDLGTTTDANQAFTGLGQVEQDGLVGTPEEAQLYDSTFALNLEKSLNNNLNQVKGIGDRAVLTTGAIAKKVLGETLATGAYRYAGLDLNQVMAETTDRLSELSSRNEQGAGFTTAEGASDIAAAIVDSGLSVGYSALLTKATFGVGLFTDMIGGSIADYNSTKAKTLGITTDELYKSGKADIIAPAVIGGLSFGLEKIGLKGVRGALTRKIQSGLGKYFTQIALDMNKEGMTEWAQYGLDQVNQHLASGGSIEDSGQVFADSVFTKDAFEQYLKGLAGTGVLAAPNVIASTITNSSTRNQALKLDQERRNLIGQLDDSAVMNDKVVRDAVLNKIDNLSNEIQNLYDEDFAKTKQNKSPEVIDEANILTTRISDIDNKINSTNTDDSGQQLTEEMKSALQDEKRNLEAQLDDLIKTSPDEAPVETKTVERNDARLEEVASRLTEINSIQEDPAYREKYNRRERNKLVSEYNSLMDEYTPLYEAMIKESSNQTETTTTINEVPETGLVSNVEEGTEQITPTDETTNLQTDVDIESISSPESLVIETDNEVVSQPTFIQSIRQNISNETRRNSRISELEDRIKNRSDSNNLGIVNDPKQQAQYWADVTEYAVLKVADKTIKTVEALGKALGIDSKTPELVSAWEDAQKVNKIISEATVTPPKKTVKGNIKEATQGGITGKVTITNRQALANQLRDLNRGSKDMERNVKDISRTIGEYISTNKDKLKGAKIPQSLVTKMVRAVSGVTNEKQLNKTLDVLEKAINDTEFRTRVSQVEANQKRLKAFAKTKGVAKDLSSTLNNFSKINPLELGELDVVEDYLSTLNNLVNLRQSKSRVDLATMQKFVDIAESTREQKEAQKPVLSEDEKQVKKIDSLKKRLVERLGMSDSDVQAIDDRSRPYDEIVADLQAKVNELKPSAEEKLREVSKEYETELQTEKQRIIDAQTNPEEKKLVQEFFDQGITEKDISKAHMGSYVVSMYNLLNNNSAVGLGMVMNEAKQSKALSDQTKVNNLNTFMQTPNLLVQQLDKWGFTSGSQTFDALVKAKRYIGDLHEHTGFADVQIKSNVAFKRMEAIKQDFNNTVKKYRKDLTDNPVKEVQLAIYADVVQYRQSWTPEQIKQEFTLRLDAWRETLKRMKEVNNSAYQKENKVIISNLEQALNEIGTPASATEIWDKLPQGHKEMYNYMRGTYDNLKNSHFAVSRVYGGLDVEQDWVNYVPRAYREARTRQQALNERQLATSGGRINDLATGSYTSSLAKENTGSGKSRLISGDKLPLNKVLNTRIFDTFLNETGAMVYDIETMAERGYTANMLNYKKHGGFSDFTDELPMEIYTSKVGMKLEGDRFAIRTPDLNPSVLRRIFSKIGKLGVANALGGVPQFIKQTSPLAEIFGRVSNPMTVGKAIAMINNPTQEVRDLLSMGDIAVRAIENEVYAPKGSSVSREQRDRNAIISGLRGLGLGADRITEKLANVSLIPLKVTDSYIAKVGWLSLYLDDASKRGSVELSKPNKASIAYANTQNSIVMNESDPSLQASFTKQGWVRMMFPFSGFSINAKMTLVNSLSRLKRARTASEIRQVSAEVAGNLSNIVMFNAIGFGIRTGAIAGGSFFLSKMIVGSDIPEEEKEKKLEELAKDEDTRTTMNEIRSTGYLVHDLMFGGIFGDYLEPATQPITDWALEKVWTEDALRASGYSDAKKAMEKTWYENIANKFGVQGVYAMKMFDTWKLGASLAESDKDYVTRRFRQVNAEHTDIVIDDYYLDQANINNFAIPDYDKASRLTSFLAGAGSLIGFSDQWINSTTRYATNISRTLVQKDHGKVSKATADELIKRSKKVNTIKVGKVEVLMDEPMKVWYYSEWSDVVNTLKEERGKRTNEANTDYEKRITDLAEKRIAKEFKVKYPEAVEQARQDGRNKEKEKKQTDKARKRYDGQKQEE